MSEREKIETKLTPLVSMTTNSHGTKKDDKKEGWPSLILAGLVLLIWGGLLLMPVFPLPIRVVLFFGIWWVILILAWLSPACFFMEQEKSLPKRISEIPLPRSIRHLLSVGFYFAYWPIYIPKRIWLVALLFLFSIYSYVKSLRG